MHTNDQKQLVQWYNDLTLKLVQSRNSKVDPTQVRTKSLALKIGDTLDRVERSRYARV